MTDTNDDTEALTHWGYGSGMVGCLFDNGPCFVETKEDAIDCVLFQFSCTGNESDLDGAMLDQAKADLRADGIHYFPSAVRRDTGADYCQIWEESGPCPEDDE